MSNPSFRPRGNYVKFWGAEKPQNFWICISLLITQKRRIQLKMPLYTKLKKTKFRLIRKNWRRKFVRRAIFLNVDVRLLRLQHGCWDTV